MTIVRTFLFSKLVYVLRPRVSGGDATFQNFLFIGKMFWFKINLIFPESSLFCIEGSPVRVFMCC